MVDKSFPETARPPLGAVGAFARAIGLLEGRFCACPTSLLSRGVASVERLAASLPVLKVHVHAVPH